MNALAARIRSTSVAVWLAVFAVGFGALTAWFLIGPLVGSTASEGYYRPVLHAFAYGFSQPLVILFIPYGLALLAWRRGSRTSMRVLLGGAIALHALLLFAPTPQSYDIHQYLFYGRMQVLHVGVGSPLAAHAGNPYLIQPAMGWWDSWYSWVKWPTQTTVYGPAWSLLAYGVALASAGSHTAAYLLMKFVIFGLDLAVMLMILRLARDRTDPVSFAGFGILAYAWNPVVLISVPLAGLADVALAAGLLGALVAARRDRTWLATALLTLITLVKIYAGVALVLWLVLLLRRRGARTAALHAVVAAVIAAVLFAPYWAGLQTFHGLFHIANLSNHSFAGVLQRLLTPVMSGLGLSSPWHTSGALVRFLGIGLLVTAMVWSILRTRTQRDLWHYVVLVLAAYCLFTPWFFYWYLVAPLALVAVLPADPLAAPMLTASGTLLITVAFWPWLVGQAVEAILRYAPPILVYALGWGADTTSMTGDARRGDLPEPVDETSVIDVDESEIPAVGTGALPAGTAATT
jgi:hypothetical protein